MKKIDEYGRNKIKLEKEKLKNETRSTAIYCKTKQPEKFCDYYKIPEGKLLNIVRKKQEGDRFDLFNRLGVLNKFKHKPQKKKPK